MRWGGGITGHPVSAVALPYYFIHGFIFSPSSPSCLLPSLPSSLPLFFPSLLFPFTASSPPSLPLQYQSLPLTLLHMLLQVVLGGPCAYSGILGAG